MLQLRDVGFHPAQSDKGFQVTVSFLEDGLSSLGLFDPTQLISAWPRQRIPAPRPRSDGLGGRGDRSEGGIGESTAGIR